MSRQLAYSLSLLSSDTSVRSDWSFFPAYLSVSRGHQDACISQCATLQLACAMLQVLESPSNKHWEQLASIEKVGVEGAVSC